MKKFVFALFLVSFGFALLVAPDVLADPLCDNGTLPADSDYCQDVARGDQNPIIVVISNATNILTMFVGVAAVIGIVVGGFNLTLSGGDPGKINKGRNAVIYSSVGIVVAVLARTIILFVLSRL